MLLGKAPQDYDIATSARPDDVWRFVPDRIAAGAELRVILGLIAGQAFGVAGFRYDGPYLAGRRPSEVRCGSLEDDVRRRGVTVDGMVCDPLADKIIDV